MSKKKKKGKFIKTLAIISGRASGYYFSQSRDYFLNKKVIENKLEVSSLSGWVDHVCLLRLRSPET